MKTKSFYFLFALALSFAISCARTDEAEVSAVSSEQMTFTASWADASRTAVQENGTDIWWMPNERINLFYGQESAVFASGNTEPAAVANFTGSLNVVLGAMEPGHANPSYFFAVYPYNADNTYDGQSATLSFSAEQTGVEGTFADGCFPAVARSFNTALSFYNVCGGARFSVVTEGVQRVVFSSVDGMPMAGKIKVGFDAQGLPEVRDITQAVDSVILTAPKGGFVPGAYYYATMLPGAHEQGMIIRLYTNKKRAQRTLDRPITVHRSAFGMLDDVDEGLEYEDSQYIPVPEPTDSIVFADTLVRKICLQYFDADKNGKLSSEEAEAVTSFSTYFNDKKIVSFDETVYFSGVTAFDGAFNGCSSLESITIPSWVTSLGGSSFMNCAALASVVIPSGVTALGINCFSGCTSLAEVEFPEGLLTLGNYAFYNCSSLEEVSLPSSVTSIGKYAFGACSSLLSVEFPVSLKTLGDFAFVGCEALRQVSLEPCEALTTIGASAFSGCTGTIDSAITVPAKVTSIGSAALKDFKYINVRPLTPPTIATDSFIGTARFGVPEESLKKYKKKGTNWYKYVNWIYPDTSFVYPPSLTTLSSTRKRLNLFGVTQDFIKVRAGSYANENNKTVTLTRDYWLAETELSRAVWIAVMNADPSNFQPTMDKAINCPVTRVSWEDVHSFISSLNKLVSSTYRLPSEAEWEFAARGGNQSQQYVYSGSNVLDEVAWYTENSKCCLDTSGAVRQQPHPAKELAPNELGFYDMSGNVYEWVNDFYSSTLPSGTDPTGPTSDGTYKRRVMRGGDYLSTEVNCTVSKRSYKKQTENGSNLGFRLAL